MIVFTLYFLSYISLSHFYLGDRKTFQKNTLKYIMIQKGKLKYHSFTATTAKLNLKGQMAGKLLSITHSSRNTAGFNKSLFYY